MQIEQALKLDLSLQAWKLYQHTEIEIILLELEPGGSIESHINPVTVSFIVLEGQGTVQVDHEEMKLKALQRIRVEAGKTRSWKNIENTVLKLLVIKEIGNN